MDTPETPNEPALSAVVIPLLKGVVCQENDPQLSSHLIARDAPTRRRMRAAMWNI